MRVFADTSAIYALLAENDQNHPSAVRTWRSLLERNAVLETTNYVMLETAALVQRRLGLAALRDLHTNIEPALAIHWMDEPQHQSAIGLTLAAFRRDLSLVDCSSFVVMEQMGITDAFCFDKHFAEQGFNVLPG